jgi:uncharacterized protein YukE
VSGGTGNPLVAQRQDSTTAYSGIGIVESIADLSSGIESGNWVDISIGGLGTSMEALGLVTDPVATLLSYGISWLIEHVKPLSDALDWLAGDPDQITAYARTWSNVAGAMHSAAGDLTRASTGDLAGWSGTAATAYHRQVAQAHAALAGISQAAKTLSTAVQCAGLLVAVVRELVRDLVADCVATLIIRIPEWLGEEGVTFGAATPLVVGQVSSLVGRWVAKIGKLLTALVGSLRKLGPVLRSLDGLVDRLGDLLRRLRTGGSPTAVPSGGAPHGSHPEVPAPVRGGGDGGPVTASSPGSGQQASPAPSTPATATGSGGSGSGGSGFGGGGGGPTTAGSPDPADGPDPSSDSDPAVRAALRRHAALGDTPPVFDMRTHDATYGNGAHSWDRHSPEIPLERGQGKTIAGRIYGDTGWDRPVNQSFRWKDVRTMNETINTYIQRHWDEIRDDLALGGQHRETFNLDHHVGEGFINSGAGTPGAPRVAVPALTGRVSIVIDAVPGSNPPQPYVVTAYPRGYGV